MEHTDMCNSHLVCALYLPTSVYVHAILCPVSIDYSHWKERVQQHKCQSGDVPHAAARKYVQSNILSSTIMSAATLLV